MEIIASVIAGAVLGWGISHYYHRKTERAAAAQSAAASAELQAVFRAFAQLAEERGWVQWTRDANGNITTGRTITATPKTANIDIGARASGTKLDD